MTKRLLRNNKLGYLFDYNKEPVLTVEQGESFIVETEDNLAGLIKSDKDPLVENLKQLTKYDPPKFNPVQGPIYINGAAKGDLLEVSIQKIIPAESGFSAIDPSAGPLCDNKNWPELGEAFIKILKNIPGPSGTTRDGKVIYNEHISWDLEPMIGTIGVATEYEVHGTLNGQTPCCGNWDCKDIKEGSKLYLNCYHDGALLFLGDVHASQGDTEWTCSANEVKAEVLLSCRVIKNKKIPYARIEREESIIQVFADKPLEDAVHRAIINLMSWMVEEYGVKPKDAYIMISCSSEFKVKIYQMVRSPNLPYVVGVEIPKKYLKN
ncbi:MAG: acetamidase/formamidase family protein [Actinomycetota bacterium]